MNEKTLIVARRPEHNAARRRVGACVRRFYGQLIRSHNIAPIDSLSLLERVRVRVSTAFIIALLDTEHTRRTLRHDEMNRPLISDAQFLGLGCKLL